MMNPITSEEEYEQAMKRLDQLMEAEPGTPEAEELIALVEAIDGYENQEYNDVNNGPIQWPWPYADSQG
jgi:HTH-type transcriptional regulator/antitoxin HigA